MSAHPALGHDGGGRVEGANIIANSFDLFAAATPLPRARGEHTGNAAHRELLPGAWLLPAFAAALDAALVDAIGTVTAAAPLRHFATARGFSMSVAMSNCGRRGWVSDRDGYRYASTDPDTGLPWPPMPAVFASLAGAAAAAAGFPDFAPDACLINRYVAGARMGLHQDRDERDLSQPIVSVSLGLDATFQFGGATRADKPLRLPLQHGDVLVFGGPARLRFHGVSPLKPGDHPRLGAQRFNLTFRRAD